MTTPGSGLRLGIDLGGTKIEIVALDRGGAVMARERVATPQDDYPAIVRAIAGLVEGVESRLGTMGTVGLACPGALSPHSGRIKNSNTQCLIGRPFGNDLETALGRPVRLANDADCFALSEASDGAGRGARCVFGVIIGTGCGGGIVVGGRLLQGPNAVAGEWGHNPLPWPRDDLATAERPGPACYCGRHACIEGFLSGPAFTADHARGGGPRLSPSDIAAAATAGDPTARASLARYVDRLARALAATINLIDPDIIVLGGGVSNLTALYQAVPPLLPGLVFGGECVTPLVRAAHGDSSGVRGAAWLWPVR